MTSLMSRLVRSVLVLSVVALIALIILFIIGGKTRNYSASVLINATPEEVFDTLTDASSLARWFGNVESIEPLTDGGHRVGAKMKITLNDSGRRTAWIDEVLHSEPNKTLLIQSTSSTARVRSDVRLDPNGEDRTVVAFTLVIFPKGINRIFMPFFGNRLEGVLSQQLERLKQFVEASRAN